MIAEEWRPIQGFEQSYEVSTMGRVRSLPRTRTQSFMVGRLPVYSRTIRATPGRVLKPKTKPNGYQEVHLSIGRKSTMFYVHRLVLEAFTGAPQFGYQAGHLNGRRDDNRLENLRWVTPLVNASHRERHGTRAVNPAKTALKRRAAGVLLSHGFTVEEIVACLALRPSTVQSLAG